MPLRQNSAYIDQTASSEERQSELENFRENLIFANCVKRHFCAVKNSQQRHD